MKQADRYYLLITIFLVIAAIVGGVFFMHGTGQAKEITLSQEAAPQAVGEVYIGGAVTNPGIYSLQEGDMVQDLLMAATVTSDADLNYVKLYIPSQGEATAPQRIDINRAEPWLLEALPGIGKVRAQDIVDYRSEHGPFRHIDELCYVKGIGTITLDKIRGYITVSD